MELQKYSKTNEVRGFSSTSIKSMDARRPGNNFFSNLLMISSATTCFFASYSILDRP